MPGSPKKRERRLAVRTKLDEPGIMDSICQFIACGGTLIEWCRRNEMIYSVVTKWINEVKDRRESLKASFDMRDDYLSEMVVRNLRQFADVDIGKAYDEAGNLLPLDRMPDDVRRCIAGFEVTVDDVQVSEAEQKQADGSIVRVSRQAQTLTKKVKLVDPAKAVELLGKYRKMFVDRMDHSGKVTLADLVAGDDG